MEGSAPDPVAMLFDRLPQAALLYARGTDEPRLERYNLAARSFVAVAAQPPLLSTARTALSTGEALRQTRIRLPDRPTRRYQIRALPLGAQHVAVLVEDITEELTRRADLSMWSDIVERLDDMFIVCTRDPSVASPGDLPVIRSTARLRVAAQAPPSDVDTRLEELARFAMTGEDIERLQPLIDKEGERSWRTERNGRVWQCQAWSTDDRLVVRLTDVTERGQLARALSDHARLLRALDETYEELVDVLARDVRLPLRELQRLRDQIRPELLPLETRVETVRAFDRAVASHRAVESLLRYARVTRLPATSGPVDLDVVLTRAMDALEPEIERSGASMRRRPLPTVWGEETALELLLTQLLSNALRYHRPGQPPLVRINAERQDGLWRISVHDEGVGIEAVRLTHIFEPFQRWGEHRGGVGLAICRRVVEHHDGRLGIQSAVGRGTTVWFEMPASSLRV